MRVARLARVIAVDVPHHVTQRGNARQSILTSDAERLVYLDLLRNNAALHQLSPISYCLMPNQVHWVVIPRKADSLALTLKHALRDIMEYPPCLQRSCLAGTILLLPLGTPHLWAALRYAELNPVRAGMVARGESYPWSSAAAPWGAAEPDAIVDMNTWQQHRSHTSWRECLATQTSEAEHIAIRQCARTGRPLGTPEFIAALEERMRRKLAPKKGGSPETSREDHNQSELDF
jgi:putative transposase